MPDFRSGQQPCQHFAPHDDEYIGSGNVHQCMAPFDKTHPCEGLVSFCEHCCKDHHSGGYEQCAGRKARTTR